MHADICCIGQRDGVVLGAGDGEPEVDGAVASVGGSPGVLVDARSGEDRIGPAVAVGGADGIGRRATVVHDKVVRHDAVAAHHIADSIHQDRVCGVCIPVPRIAIAHRDTIAASSRYAGDSSKYRETTVHIGRIRRPMAIDTCCVVGIHPGVESRKKCFMNNAIYHDCVSNSIYTDYRKQFTNTIK